MKNVNTVGDGHQSLLTASPFRIWVQNLWMENREERLVFGDDPVTIQQYWKTYKWWIKREYKHSLRQKEF
jgi:hypothetical protein